MSITFKIIDTLCSAGLASPSLKTELRQNLLTSPSNRFLFKYISATKDTSPEIVQRVFQQKDPYTLYLLAYLQQKRLPEELEDLLSTSTTEAPIYYAADVLKGRWGAHEKFLLQRRYCPKIVTYTRVVLRTRWPEAEAILKQKGYWRAYQTVLDVND